MTGKRKESQSRDNNTGSTQVASEADKRIILVSMIDDFDLLGLAATEDVVVRNEIAKRVWFVGGAKGQTPPESKTLVIVREDPVDNRLDASFFPMPSSEPFSSPLKAVLDNLDFDEVHLFSYHCEEINASFSKWLNHPAKIHAINCMDADDCSEVFPLVDAEMKKVMKDPSKTALYVHINQNPPKKNALWAFLNSIEYPVNKIAQHLPRGSLFHRISKNQLSKDSLFQELAWNYPHDFMPFHEIAGNSPSMLAVKDKARRCASHDVSVLLLGESGTGKDMLANAIHKTGPRRDGPYVPVNCGAFTATMLESELFGHEKGAFTGASSRYVGAFERADKGTLFLDEIAECSPDLQVKLLRVLQQMPGDGLCQREITRLGATKPITVDARIIAATNRNLREAVAKGEFREDLYYRLDVMSISVPALRDRKQDIPKIARKLLSHTNAKFLREDERAQHDSHESQYIPKTLSPEAIEALSEHSWPGNVRELNNVLVKAAMMSDRDEITSQEILSAISEMPRREPDVLNQPLGKGLDLTQECRKFEGRYVIRALNQSQGNVAEAGRLLGLKRQTLAKKVTKLKELKMIGTVDS